MASGRVPKIKSERKRDKKILPIGQAKKFDIQAIACRRKRRFLNYSGGLTGRSAVVAIEIVGHNGKTPE